MNVDECNQYRMDTRGPRLVGAAGVVALLAATALGASIGAWKPVQVGWVAFAAMVGGVWLALRAGGERPRTMVWGSGLASGAMIVSVGLFLLPDALNHHPRFGGLGVATGVIVGFAAHTIGNRLSHTDLPMDSTVAQLTAHAAAAGAIIGIVYGNMNVGLLLGVAIVSHKGPAGYAAADRLTRNGRSWYPILLPAAGVGVVAVLVSAVQLPAVSWLNGLVFGFATGVFLHVAMDFLPRCELGSEVHDALSVDDDAHEVLDRLRLHAVASTALGGVVVFLGWALISYGA